jgi:hypothetical protein
VLAALLIAAGPASAAVKEGDKEISVYGAVTNISADVIDLTITTIQLAGGFFVSDAAQIGGSLTNQSTSGDAEGTTRVVGGFFKYHVNPKDTTIPYFGAQVGLATYESGSVSESAVSYGPLAGVKIFVSENLSINPEADVIFTTILDIDVTITIFQVGMSYYF